MDDKNGRGLAHNVMTTSRNLQKQFDIPESKAMGLAAKFMLEQDGEILDTRISLYDYDKLEGLVDTEKVNNYIESIKATKSEKAEQEIGNMYGDIVRGINRSNLSEDEKMGELNALNQIVSPYIAIVGPESRVKTPEDMDKETETKEPLSVEQLTSKYNLDENLINTLRKIKPKGSVTQQSPLREDPIDLITDQMLADSGYIDSVYAGALPKAFAKRKFIKDFYNDLGL
jgi:uncharacterized protein YaaR (DUF327 family)